jgi:cullin 3
MDKVSSKLEETSSQMSDAASENLLQVVVEKWDNHKLVMTMIRDVLMYMDKTYVKTANKMPVYDMGLILFQKHVVQNNAVKQRLGPVLLDNIQCERKGEAIDRVLIKHALSMLVEVAVNSRQVYVSEFELDFLEQTRTFYQQESQEFMQHNTCPDYLRKVEGRLIEEENRADTYLDKTTKPKLRQALHEELIVKYAQIIVENQSSGIVHMFQNDQMDDLARLYRLFRRVPKETIPHIRSALSKTVRQAGIQIVQDQENIKNPKVFVQNVLECRSKYNRIVMQAFAGDRLLARTLKDSLEYFINLDSRAAKYLSLYTDALMKHGLKGVTEAEIETMLNQIVSIFRYVSDKDVFEDFYKQQLSVRLLSGQTGNSDVEKLMISKLKSESGHQFTSKLEGMFNDMDNSRQVLQSFARYQDDNPHPEATISGAELNVTVLTTGFWPISNVPECHLPEVAGDLVKSFTSYYTAKHSGRVLTWQPNLGTAELRCQFTKGRKELVVHTYQMCILMLFNSRMTYSYAEIRELTNIPDKELQRHILSLAHPKVRVLRKKPNTKSIADDHQFMYNMGYTSQMYRVKIKLLAPATVEVKQAEVPPAVLEGRKNRVEAAIVRVMKSRKRLEHNNLVAEVMKQLADKFSVKPAFIKKRIENLIEREYLERDPENRRVYQYLA